MHTLHTINRCLLALGIAQCLADACLFRLMDEGRVVVTSVVHVDDTFAVGEKARCDHFGRDWDQMVPVEDLGELLWSPGCFHERD